MQVADGGVPVASPSTMVVDNESVVNSVSVPESRLKKKHLSICCHSVREAVAGGTALLSDGSKE